MRRISSACQDSTSASTDTPVQDAGFYRDKFMASWKPRDYVQPSVALQSGLNIPQRRMVELAGNANRVIPGHDPAVFTRFKRMPPNVAQLP